MTALNNNNSIVAITPNRTATLNKLLFGDLLRENSLNMKLKMNFNIENNSSNKYAANTDVLHGISTNPQTTRPSNKSHMDC